jgi:hypothetical protein
MLAVASVVGALGSAVSAASASANVPGLRPPFSAESDFNSTVYKAVRVFCPAGTQVIGGGYQLVGAEGAVVLDDFIPSPDNLLVGAGEIVGPGEPSDDSGTDAPWKIVATVMCASTMSGYSIQPVTSDFTSNRPKSELAVCPPGRAVIGGGASLSNGFGQVSIQDLSITSTGVKAQADEDVDGYSGNWSVTTYAICATVEPAGWRVVTQPTTTTALGLTMTAFCGSRETPIGAGWFQSDPTFGIDRYITRSTISTNPDPGVTAAAVSLRTGPIWSMTAAAVCVQS